MAIVYILAISLAVFILYKWNKSINKEIKEEHLRWEELRQAEKELRDLTDIKNVADVNMVAAELRNKIDKLKRKINKERKNA